MDAAAHVAAVIDAAAHGDAYPGAVVIDAAAHGDVFHGAAVIDAAAHGDVYHGAAVIDAAAHGDVYHGAAVIDAAAHGDVYHGAVGRHEIRIAWMPGALNKYLVIPTEPVSPRDILATQVNIYKEDSLATRVEHL